MRVSISLGLMIPCAQITFEKFLETPVAAPHPPMGTSPVDRIAQDNNQPRVRHCLVHALRLF